MDNKKSVLQIYAMIIGTVCVITFLIAVGAIISSVIDRSEPLYARGYEQNLTSFEHFKMESLRSVNKEQVYIPDDEALSKMYDAAKAERIKLVYHQTKRSLVVNSILLLASIALFTAHWRWIKGKSGT